jgi:hypothetical protein
MSGELAMIFVAGLLGSSHCIGMCGGFAMILGLDSRSRWRGLPRQCAYSAGRIFTYSTLGAIAGLLGHRLTSLGLANSALRIGAGLCVLAGLFLVYEGLRAAGWTLGRRANSNSACGGCFSGPLLSNFLRQQGLTAAFLGGVMTGFLPCGLVYAFLALAAARLNPLEGMAVMAAFGLGTVPLMVAAGVGSTLLSLAGRRRMLRVAAWCVVVTGLLTIVRGAGYLRADNPTQRPACPFCTGKAATTRLDTL